MNLMQMEDSRDQESLVLDFSGQKAAMEEKLKNTPWIKKKLIMKDFLANENKQKKQKDADPKTEVKNQYRDGKISAFAAQNLLRVYEVMDEHESISKLHIHNRKRWKEINESLDMSKREGKVFRKRDFETYQRKKTDLFAW